MDRVSLDSFVLMKFLEVKKLPFWIYVHDPIMDRMEQVTPSTYTDGLLFCLHFSLYKKDFGPYIESDDIIPDDSKYYYNYVNMDEIRTDNDFILLSEEFSYIYGYSMRAIDIPEGEDFAIIPILDGKGGVEEKLLLKSQLNWIKSE